MTHAQQQVRSILLGHWRGISCLLGLALTGAALQALKPWPLKIAVDYALSGRPLPDGWPLPWRAISPQALLLMAAAGMVLIFLAAWCASATTAYLQSGIGSQLRCELAARMVEHLQRLSLRYHSRQITADLVRRVTVDSMCIRQLTMNIALSAFTSLLTLVMMFAIMWQLNRGLTLASFLVVPPLALSLRLLYPRMAACTAAEQQEETELLAIAEQALVSLPVIQSFTREEIEDQRYADQAGQVRRATLRSAAAQSRLSLLVGTITALGSAALFTLGGLFVLGGSLTIGDLLVFLAYLASLYAPLESMADLSGEFARARSSLRRTNEILAADDHVSELASARPLRHRVRGTLTFDRVTFGYEVGQAVLEEVTLTVHSGETVALVGASGAGKTTLACLVPRLFDPWEGCVRLDGADLREIRLGDLRSQVAMVLQDPFLLPMSVFENIAYGRPDATSDEVIAAARVAGAHEFIERLEQGYDTIVGERGATLSGGQKQRLSIARAVLKDAPVLILDEPTSALDGHTEHLVMQAIQRLSAGRTTLLIAHRLSTIRRADRIVVLSHGRVIESGTHDDLLAAGSAYFRLDAAARSLDPPQFVQQQTVSK